MKTLPKVYRENDFIAKKNTANPIQYSFFLPNQDFSLNFVKFPTYLSEYNKKIAQNFAESNNGVWCYCIRHIDTGHRNGVRATMPIAFLIIDNDDNLLYTEIKHGSRLIYKDVIEKAKQQLGVKNVL